MLFCECMTINKRAQNVSRINDVLSSIHQDISRELSGRELAKVAAYSEQHFHRLFKQVVGESVHQYIKRTRMEYAANLLMFDTHATVLEIANRAGFSSVSSFSRAFHSIFHVSPGSWRQTMETCSEQSYQHDPEIAGQYRRLSQVKLDDPEIIQVPARHVAYLRHTGYNRSIKKAWQYMMVWADSEGRDSTAQYGLHHSNPAWVELDKCRYVACIAIDKPLKNRSVINQMTIPGGLHARFHLQGQYGELIPYMSVIMERWLPGSGFKMQSTPAYVQYHKNHFLCEDERFDLDLYIPLGFY